MATSRDADAIAAPHFEPETRSNGDEETVLHESARSRVVRSYSAKTGRSVIRKELLGDGSIARMRHEVAMLERLEGINGIPRLNAAQREGSHAFELKDDGGIVLAEALKN